MDTYTQNQARAVAGGMGEDHESASRMMEEDPAAQPAKDGWIVDNVSIRQAKNGGWIVSCSKHKDMPAGQNSGPGSYQSNDYTFGSLAEAVPFLEQEFGASAEGSTMPAPAQPTGGMA